MKTEDWEPWEKERYGKKSYEVFIPIATASDIMLADSTSGSQTSNGVTAKLTVEYEVNSTNEMVKAKKDLWKLDSQ